MFREEDALAPPGQAHEEEHLDFIHPPEVTQHAPTLCQPLGPEVPRHTAGPLIPLTDQELGPQRVSPSSGHCCASQCGC